MFSLPNGKITIAQLLLPVSLVAFVLALMLAFQFTQILLERDAIKQAMTQQDKPLDDAKKVGTQLNALAMGTKKLADKGDKSAKAIIDRMKKMGISVGEPPPASPPSAAQGRNPPMPSENPPSVEPENPSDR